jgi:hypothetical protein
MQVSRNSLYLTSGGFPLIFYLTLDFFILLSFYLSISSENHQGFLMMKQLSKGKPKAKPRNKNSE